MMRRLAGILLLLSVNLVAAADLKPARPDWCQPGWVCVERKEMAADARYKIDLEERITLAEARLKARRLFGWHATCGFGIAATATADFDVKAVPAGYCGVGWGW